MSEKVTKNVVRIIFLFIIFLLLIFFNSNEIFATEGDTIATGKSGDCTYTITELADGTYSVTISGEGAMEDYSTYSRSPFYTYREYISEVHVEDGVTTIGAYSFSGQNYNYYTYLYTHLTLLDCSGCKTLTNINAGAFRYCSYLTKIDLSGCTSLTIIGRYAFYYCSSLTSANIDFLSSCKSTLEEIGDYAFGYWSNLTELDLSDYTALTYLSGFCYCSNLTKIDLSGCSAITEIGDYAFGGCSLVSNTNLDFLDDCISTLERIGHWAFYLWESLEKVDLSGAPMLKNIGCYAFGACDNLRIVDLSNCFSLQVFGTPNENSDHLAKGPFRELPTP